MSNEFDREKEEAEKDSGMSPKAKNIMKEILNTGIYILGVLLVSFFIIHYIGQRTIVVGDSMLNTLHDGDNLIVDKMTYAFKDPERYDIIVFPYKYKEDTLFIKRIIGLPGETVQIDEAGNIYINGERLEENYGRETMVYAGLASEPILLGADEYFVLGDNRNYSEDSRFADVGIIDSEDIVGRAIFRLYPFDRMGVIDKE